MLKLTKELKHLVINGIVHRFTISEIQQYVQSRLNTQITIPYIKCLKSELKNDSKKELDYLAKDRFAFIHSIFFERLEELKSYQKTLHNIVLKNPEKPEAQVKAISELKDITLKIQDLYGMLPTIVSNPGVSSSAAIMMADENNNNVLENNNNNSRWCSDCNKLHARDKYGHKKCPQWKVGMEYEDEPRYYGRDDIDLQREF